MTTAAPEPRPSRIVRFGHHYPIIAAVCIPLAFTVPFSKLIGNGIVQTTWSTAGTAASLLLLAAVLASMEHHRRMCPLDSSPVLLRDPDELIVKHRRQLRLWHNPWLALTVTICAFGFSVLHDYVLPESTAGRWVYASFSALAALAFAGIARVEVVHQRLTLWCPQCRRGRGEDDIEIAPTPTPRPAAPLTT